MLIFSCSLKDLMKMNFPDFVIKFPNRAFKHVDLGLCLKSDEYSFETK
jgi:hypothetical protein